MKLDRRCLTPLLLLAACGQGPMSGDDDAASGGTNSSTGGIGSSGGGAGSVAAASGASGAPGFGGSDASGGMPHGGGVATPSTGGFIGGGSGVAGATGGTDSGTSFGGSSLGGGSGLAGANAGTAPTSGTSAGGSSLGGASAGTSGSGGGTAFALVFRDDFDALDSARWQLMTHSWDGNLALFSASAATVQSGQLVLRLTPAPSGTVDPNGAPKQFLGAEVRSRETLTYGRVRARARLARGSAAISALVTIYTPWPADDWNEFDIECLGRDPANTQFNAMVYTGPPVTPPVTSSVSPTQFPQIVNLGFDPSADFHVYTIEWTPAGARFLVDEVVRHTWSTRIDLIGLPQNTLLTIWASSSVDWAGAVNATTGQAVATYDWVELYRYAP